MWVASTIVLQKAIPHANGTAALEDMIDLKSSLDSHAFSWSDLQTWQAMKDSIDTLITEKERRGQRRVFTLLDVGCGDGVWAIRVANYCLSKDVAVEVECLDLSDKMLRRAESLFSTYISVHGITSFLRVRYHKCNLAHGLGDDHRHQRYDLTLCLHTVLNHVPSDTLDNCVRELVMHTSSFLFFSIKPPLSRPTFYAAPMSEIIRYERRDEHLYALDLKGRFHVIRSNLISAERLHEMLSQHSVNYEFIALDVIISRFMPDPQWLGDEQYSQHLPMDDLLALEAKAGMNPRLLDFANHILAVVDTRRDG